MCRVVNVMTDNVLTEKLKALQQVSCLNLIPRIEGGRGGGKEEGRRGGSGSSRGMETVCIKGHATHRLELVLSACIGTFPLVGPLQ